MPAFELSMWCGTCPAIFRKLADPGAADLQVIGERLRTGLARIDDEVLEAYGKVLPEAPYTVLLLELTPNLVEPGQPSDYFAHERVETWGLDATAGAADNPNTAYYRTYETSLGPSKHLFELAVPMVPPAWNTPQPRGARSLEHSDELPTAVAYSLLDRLQPAMDFGEDYYEHWVLTHFLLDGHHKFESAARANSALRLLALVDERISLAGQDDLAALIAARSQPAIVRTKGS